MRFELIVKAYIVRGDTYLRLRNAAKDPHSPGAWTLPGGHVEPGEDIIDALVRECKEEVGLSVIPQGVKQTRHFTGREGDVQIIIITFECAAAGDVRLSPEHDLYEWADESIPFDRR